MTHPSKRMSEAEIVSIETDDLGAFVMLSSNNRPPIRYAIPLPVAEAFRTDLAAANERAERAEQISDTIERQHIEARRKLAAKSAENERLREALRNQLKIVKQTRRDLKNPKCFPSMSCSYRNSADLVLKRVIKKIEALHPTTDSTSESDTTEGVPQ